MMTMPCHLIWTVADVSRMNRTGRGQSNHKSDTLDKRRMQNKDNSRMMLMQQWVRRQHRDNREMHRKDKRKWASKVMMQLVVPFLLSFLFCDVCVCVCLSLHLFLPVSSLRVVAVALE